jgi:branched-chain amino acid transport system ATP-binding protein
VSRPVLTIRDLHCSYGAAAVVSGLDLEVGAGEVVGLLGRNGMGKTTLVRAIAGMHPPAVRRGEIIWQDQNVTAWPSYEIARLGIGIVPQGRHIFGSLTVTENLTVAARGAADGPDDGGGWTLDRVFEFFPRLAERSGSRGKNLSGGEQQMLAIGRALMTNPTLMLMDEPSEGLAPAIVKAVRERLEDLKGSGLSIFLVEQNLGLALRLCDRIYILGATGTTVWHGTPTELEGATTAMQEHLGV